MYDIYLSVGTDISEPVVTGRCWFVFNFYFCIFLQFLFHFWYFYFLMYIVCSVYCLLVLVLPLWRINFIILAYFYQSAGVKDVSTDLNIEMVRESLTETGQWPWRRHSGLTLHIYRRRFSDDRLLYSGCVRKWYQCLYGLAYIGAPKVINCSEGYFYVISVTTLLLHCDKPVSLYVCLSVRTHISAATCTKFATLSVHVTCGCGSVLLKLRCDMLRISGFGDDVV